MVGSPNISNYSCRAYIEIYETRDLDTKIYTNKTAPVWAVNSSLGWLLVNQVGGDLKLLKHPLVGDLYIRCRNNGSLKNTTLFWVGFNTTFISDRHWFFLCDLDPDSIRKDPWYPEHLAFELVSTKLCSECTSKMSVKERCKDCYLFLLKFDQISWWVTINTILINHHTNYNPSKESASSLLYSQSHIDVDEILEKLKEEEMKEEESQVCARPNLKLQERISNELWEQI